MMAMLWAQQIMLGKAAFADVPRLLKDKVKALLVDSGCAELAEEIFQLPTRLGYPRNVGGLKDVINNPKFATAVGLLFYGAEKESEEAPVRFANAPSSAAESSLFHGVWERMKRWFGDIR